MRTPSSVPPPGRAGSPGGFAPADRRTRRAGARRKGVAPGRDRRVAGWPGQAEGFLHASVALDPQARRAAAVARPCGFLQLLRGGLPQRHLRWPHQLVAGHGVEQAAQAIVQAQVASARRPAGRRLRRPGNAGRRRGGMAAGGCPAQCGCGAALREKARRSASGVAAQYSSRWRDRRCRQRRSPAPVRRRPPPREGRPGPGHRPGAGG